MDDNVFSSAVSPTESIPPKVTSPSYNVPTSLVTSPLTSPPASSYPAVLVGRSNSESKPKVPPPVPPRGTPKVKRGGASGKGVDCGVHGFKLVHEKRNAIERMGEALYSSCVERSSVLSGILGKQTGKFTVCSDTTREPHGSEIILKCFKCIPQEHLKKEGYLYSQNVKRLEVLENASVASGSKNCCLSRNNYFLGITPYINSDVIITDNHSYISRRKERLV